MTPQQSLARGVRIAVAIGPLVVATVMRRPPQRTALGGGSTDQGKQELNRPRGTKRAVSEIPVIKRGDREHSDEIAERAHRDRDPRNPDPEHGQAGDMQRNERQDSGDIDLVGIAAGVCSRARGDFDLAGIEPGRQGSDNIHVLTNCRC